DFVGAAGVVEEITAHVTGGEAEAAAEAEVNVREILADPGAEFEGVGGPGVDAGGLRLVGEIPIHVATELAEVGPDIAAAGGEGILGLAPELDFKRDVAGVIVEFAEHFAFGG